RVRRAVREAPAALPPLAAVLEALAAELADVEERHEIWSLRATVLQRSPRLLVRGLGAHMADELELAEAIAERIGAEARDPDGLPALELYPRLLAGVAGTAVRVAVEHWCSKPPGTAVFADVFREVFSQLAAGLPGPPAPDPAGT
ncbi:TetR family transcriptional regulator, partial [Streptomyces sp. 150FB]